MKDEDTYLIDDDVWSIENSTILATGFVIGGITAAYWDLGFLTIAAIGGAILLVEVLLIVIGTYYEAYKEYGGSSDEE